MNLRITRSLHGRDKFLVIPQTGPDTHVDNNKKKTIHQCKDNDKV